MKEDFSCEASRLAWELFKATGEIQYYQLFNSLEDPALMIECVQEDNGMEL